MRHLWNVGQTHGSVAELHSAHVGGVLLHALLNRHLCELLLSAAVILLISLFTVATIVLMVTTVNGSLSTTGAWSRWTSSPVVGLEESLPATGDLTLQMNATENVATVRDWVAASQVETGYAALPASEQ